MKNPHFKIENIKLTAFNAKDFIEYSTSEEMRTIATEIQNSYLSWDKFKNKSWVPNKEKEKIWSWIKIQRHVSSKATPILDQNGKPFFFNSTGFTEFLHQVDLELGGNFMGIDDFSNNDKQKFIRRNLIEESIASSQLEGANTSRFTAKKMLQEGRKPKDKSEQMIVNNHQTMQWIEEEFAQKDLSLDTLCELHRRITHNTIEEEHIGVLRETFDKNGNPLTVRPWDGNTITYTAPPKEFVEANIQKLILFANDQDNGDFIHPLLKAIMLHFWIGLLHPFEDGNGRLARTLFYWYMLKRKYWAFSYLSLSERILKSSKQYSMAYIYTEQDDNDLNYFIHYNIQKLKLARNTFQEYIKRKVAENKNISVMIGKGYKLNQRQLRLLQYLAKNEQSFTLFSEYYRENNISKMTASSDLKKLVNEDLLKRVRSGKNVYYYPTTEVNKLFKL
jgi:Fic family protein